MIPRPLQRRSSWQSNLVTGLIGWNGLLVLVGLAFQGRVPISTLFLLGTLLAATQVLTLRLGFCLLRMHRSVLVGALWGALSGLCLLLVALALVSPLQQSAVLWLLTAAYAGPAVGAFLSYFHRDDRRIDSLVGSSGNPVDYGRDSHWLEPFVYGAVAYLLVVVPVSWDVALAALVVGAMGGVVAAGVSHFFLFVTPRDSALPFALALLAGVVQGWVSGLLFGGMHSELWSSPEVLGMFAGALTYVVTAWRASTLARGESEAA